MPPFLPRKRLTSPVSPRPVSVKRARLTDALDAEATNRVQTLKQTRTFSVGSDDSSSSSSLSDIDSDQFEDVPARTERSQAPNAYAQEDDEDENIEWEDAEAAAATPIESASAHVPMANGSIQITLRKDDEDVVDYGTTAKAGNGKKGPSKREKQARIVTHQLHVQFLLWHNAIRNSWIGDKKVQEILVKQLPPQILREIDKWKRSSGLLGPESEKSANAVRARRRGKAKEETERTQRDWGMPSQRLEAGKPDMSHGDPLISLMKVLSAYWKKRFAITAPGLRKRGYGTKWGLKQDIVSLRNDEHNPERHGERIQSLAEFRELAQKGEGSRDVGAQLFTALLRGLGIEARLIASLQPSGYGWTKVEQMLPRKPSVSQAQGDFSDNDVRSSVSNLRARQTKPSKPSRASARQLEVIDLDSDQLSDDEEHEDVSLFKDDNSIIDVTPSMPKKRKSRFDRDLTFPIYWTEAISPVTKKVIPISPLVLESSVATTPEALSLFEPRGAKAEKSRLVMAYVIAHSPDGTAKDVTTRYLRKKIWPGKTKGFRLPIEKVPVYDERGRVKTYSNYDWFKHILGPYTRSEHDRTTVDYLEDATDLVPREPEKKSEEGGIDTLQSLKSSAEFVLERFLRREEALRSDAKPVRTFVSGKGDKFREEPVYRRADVERCLTAESWHKEGRRPKLGEMPMKMVPVRAVTLTRKREAEEHERQYGEKQTQGLYSVKQTEFIIPPPIQNGIIPKNAYGNIDCFVETMVPKGAVHIPLKGTVRICKKLEIDFAEAVTGFEFGNKRAVPVCTGVVVAVENEKLVRDAWREWNAEQRRKEDVKMEKLVLDLWRKFVLGLRIRERVQDMYGEDIGIVQDVSTGFTKEDAIAIDDEDEHGRGGFVAEEEEETEEMGGGFLLAHEEEAAPMTDLIMDDQPHSSLLSNPHTNHLTTSSLPDENADDSHIASSTASTPNEESEMPEHELHSNNDESAKEDRGETDDSTDSLPLPMSSQRKQKSRTTRRVTLTEADDRGSSSKLADVSLSETEDEDNQSSETEEIYTPRSTKTRTSKHPSSVKPHPTPKSHHKSRAEVKSVKHRNRTVSSQGERKSTATNAIQHPEVGEYSKKISSSTKPPPSPQPGRRGRGKVPTVIPSSNFGTGDITDTPKRSVRLLRKESTLKTSHYFGKMK